MDLSYVNIKQCLDNKGIIIRNDNDGIFVKDKDSEVFYLACADTAKALI